MSLFSFIGDLIGGNAKKQAISQAAAAQIAGAQQGIGAIGDQNTLIQSELQPYQQAGTQALGAQTNLLGLGGAGSQDSAIQALINSPLFQSLFRTGQEAITQNAAATGGLRGGNIQSSLATFGSDTLAKVIQQQLSNLGGISGQGLTATDAGGAFGANSADNIASLYGQQGAIQGNADLARGGVNQQLWASGGNLFGQAENSIGQLLQSLSF